MEGKEESEPLVSLLWEVYSRRFNGFRKFFFFLSFFFFFFCASLVNPLRRQNKRATVRPKPETKCE